MKRIKNKERVGRRRQGMRRWLANRTDKKGKLFEGERKQRWVSLTNQAKPKVKKNNQVNISDEGKFSSVWMILRPNWDLLWKMQLYPLNISFISLALPLPMQLHPLNISFIHRHYPISPKYTLHFIGITTIINTELVAILSATDSVAQLAEHRTSFVRSRVWFSGGWPKVVFFPAGPGWVLKLFRHSKICLHQKYYLLAVECKCHNIP